MDIETVRDQMVKQQVRAWDVLDMRVLTMLESLPRESFVSARYRDVAYADTQIPLAHGELMMAPKVEGRALQALDPKSGERALEIGTGSGFFAACLAKLADQVLSVDIHADFTETASKTLRSLGIKNVKLETRDGTRLDWTTERYDVIAITGSLPVYDAAYADRLTVGGRLFAIVGQPPVMEALLVTRTAEDAWTRQSLFETDLPPLINAVAPRKFEF